MSIRDRGLCPVCKAPGGFHDDGPHAARQVPPELVYTARPEPTGRTVWPTGEPIMEDVWRRPDGESLPHLRKTDRTRRGVSA